VTHKPADGELPPEALLPVNHGKSELPLLLIVEDNPDLRTYMQDQLAGEYRIMQAENGAVGFEQAVNRMPDLIITDVMMPEMTGTEMTAKLKQDERSSHIPVIMLTAKAEQEDKLEGLETGADDYLLKPFNTRELEVRVRNLIEQRRLLREKFARSSLLAPQEVAVSSVDEQFLNRLLEVIEEHIDNEAFSVEEMGRQVGLSRSQLHRKLKALTGQPPNVFLRTIRLQRAYQLLSRRAGNTSEIAFMTGFSSASYFSKCFKDHFRMTPSEVLQQL
jgi:DNA-binding response OmpR family regulator